MTPMILAQCLALLETMHSGQEWTPNVEQVYRWALEPWDDAFGQAVIKHAVLNCKWRPAPADLREIAAKLASPYPSADEAYAEMLERAERDGVYAAIDPERPSCRVEGAPSFSHPLIAQAVAYCGGWRMICNGEAQMQEGLSKQFKGAYERAAEKWLRDVGEALALPPARRPAHLFAAARHAQKGLTAQSHGDTRSLAMQRNGNG